MSGALVSLAKKGGEFALKKALRLILVKLDNDGIIPSKLLDKFRHGMEKVMRSIDVLRHKEFGAAKLHMQTGFDLFLRNHDDHASEEFTVARENAVLAFHAVTSLKDKIEAMHIASVCAIFECSRAMGVAKIYVKNALSQLLLIDELQEMVDIRAGNAGFLLRWFGAGQAEIQETVDLFLAGNWAMYEFLATDTEVRWGYVETKLGALLHPLAISSQQVACLDGDHCSADTIFKEEPDEMAAADYIPVNDVIRGDDEPSSGSYVMGGKTWTFPVTGDAGYRLKVTMDVRSVIQSVVITSKYGEQILMLSDGQKCFPDFKAAFKGNLVLLSCSKSSMGESSTLRLFDANSGALFWEVTTVSMRGKQLEWTCGRHVQVSDSQNNVNHTLFLW